MSTQTTIGQILDTPQERDAIHIAVASVISATRLKPGDHIGFIYRGSDEVTNETDRDIDMIGVVDPFLKRLIKPGERIWMFMYPDTITDLRHHWTHPALPSPRYEEEDEDSYDGCRGC
jgi:hypothetical protein